jgi:hypothetical protein
MPDSLKIGALYEIGECSRNIQATIRDKRIAKAAASFEANVLRIERLAQMQVRIVLWTMHFQRANDLALVDVLGRMELNKDEIGNETLRAQIEQAANAHLNNILWKMHADPNGEDAAKHAGINNMSQLIGALGEPLLTGWGVVLTSTITGAWTAFESLAGDLWEQALNANPNRFASLQGTVNRIEKIVDRKRRGKTIELELPKRRKAAEASKAVGLVAMHKLTSGDFNLSERMGTLLRDEVSFARLDDIRGAYSIAFHGSKCRTIDIALGCLALDALSAVRNLIVHRAAIGDQEYLDNTIGVPGAPRVALNEPLKLDGQIVRDLVAPVLQRAVGLIRAADELCAAAS